MKGRRHALLLVDKNANDVLSLGRLLRRRNYIVQSSVSAEDALKTMAWQHYSLVLTEVSLPGMSGVDMLKEMRLDARFIATPVIIYTGEAGPAIEAACMHAGCTSYVKKPAELDVLHNTIQAAIKATPRKSIRIDTALPVEIGHGSVSEGTARPGFVSTLSENGVFIKTPPVEPVHSVVPLTIAMNNITIKAKAIVLYNSANMEGRLEAPGMGMKFVEISHVDRAFVREYIQAQLTKEHSRRNMTL